MPSAEVAQRVIKVKWTIWRRKTQAFGQTYLSIQAKPGLRSEVQITPMIFALDPCSYWRSTLGTEIQGKTFAIALYLNAAQDKCNMEGVYFCDLPFAFLYINSRLKRVNPLYTDFRYNNKLRCNDNLNVTKPLLKTSIRICS